ncbi:protein kinase domain containing protein [Entamoeba histolytica HM-1:IMSS-B]|uniref:Protein kinase domain containing protein n=6 Tax=Entamoeba histolytica TaxID=5759 RepID=C4M7W0_ENTH1|nr:protein kinase domain containing protein [Entamoeba histolytica HM-1:IMSS]EMD42506.1 protein kinase domain containing protein [Entamoeba histolytica KU27]EMH78131.1 protein kinase domain containing protein [Entamoeba histolytica HM-1:IMSS-B]EMS17795.1 protein kinase domain containing protein [Entamoeba histolytica HM-3:IMSS]ENY65828.1 protein kinase domain containing protein [Entamoeba histolytica HM-1:IMSS-A]GAT97644.1 protein kinase domain containing protein [Entamoeba histolytica]|eukprot:XP_650081.1 protein kinase domain containing protein [Entamoeba histolytica HM-1:IMSS]
MNKERVNITLASESEINRYTLQEVIHSNKDSVIQNAIEKSPQGARTVVIKRHLINMNKKDIVLQYSEALRLLQQCEHINIIKIYNCFFCYFNGSLQFWIVMEKCTQMDLLSFIRSNTSFGVNEQTMFFMCDISYAIEYLSKNYSLFQYSLTPEHLLLTRDPSSPIPLIKLTNLFSLVTDLEELFYKNCYYNPPEYLKKKIFDNSVIWSIGVIFFMLVHGHHPLEIGKTDIMYNILHMKPIEFPSTNDELFKDLIKRMLVYDPNKRISLDQFFSHPFIEKCRKFKWGKPSDPSIYHPIKIVGKGSYGTVIYALRIINGDKTPVAIKEIPYTGRDSIIREARVMRMCKHPNLVDYYDYFELPYSICEGGKQGKYSYLVMEYCDRGTLETYLHAKKRPLQDFEILHFLSEICSGLWYLHFNKHLLHRDLKLDNFLLKTPTQINQKLPRLKITDYGFSRIFGTESQLITSFLGTPIYASPEILNEKGYTVKSDLYSVGVILYVLATNQFPFSDDKDVFLEKMRREEPLQFPPDVIIDPMLKDLICHLITHKEADRCSWEEFFQHPYVQRAVPIHSLPTHNDFRQFKEQEIDMM